MYRAIDIDGWFASLAFVLLVMLGNFFALNFCVAIVIGEFQRSVAEMYHMRAQREAYGLVEYQHIMREIREEKGLLRARKDPETGVLVPNSVTGNDLVVFLVANNHAEAAKGAETVIRSMLAFRVLQRVHLANFNDPAYFAIAQAANDLNKGGSGRGSKTMVVQTSTLQQSRNAQRELGKSARLHQGKGPTASTAGSTSGLSDGEATNSTSEQLPPVMDTVIGKLPLAAFGLARTRARLAVKAKQLSAKQLVSFDEDALYRLSPLEHGDLAQSNGDQSHTPRSDPFQQLVSEHACCKCQSI